MTYTRVKVVSAHVPSDSTVIQCTPHAEGYLTVTVRQYRAAVKYLSTEYGDWLRLPPDSDVAEIVVLHPNGTACGTIS